MRRSRGFLSALFNRRSLIFRMQETGLCGRKLTKSRMSARLLQRPSSLLSRMLATKLLWNQTKILYDSRLPNGARNAAPRDPEVGLQSFSATSDHANARTGRAAPGQN